MMDGEISKIFKELNNVNINYFVIRDFSDLNSINDSQDIDVFIPKNVKSKVDKIFRSNGWYTPFINDNKKSHKQYYKIINKRIVKFDIVNEIYFGNQNYYFCEKVINLEKYRCMSYIKVAEEKNALYIMLFHIIFDKGQLSTKNYRILNQMYLDYKKKYKTDDEIILLVDKIIKEKSEYVNNNLKTLKDSLKKYLKKSFVLNVSFKIKRKILSLFKNFYEVVSKRNIALIGVDGSGKSSTIDSLKEIFTNRSTVVYMGMKEYQLLSLKKLMKLKNPSILKKVLRLFLLRYEYYYRYYRYRFSNKIIIFDRYVDDIFINANNNNNKLSFIDKFLFKILFPKPRIKVYLYCTAESSFERKNDILDKEIFISMKKRYDNYYLNKNESKKIICIDTTRINEEETLELIVQKINEEYPYFMI